MSNEVVGSITLSDEEYTFLSRYTKETDRQVLTERCENVLQDSKQYHTYLTLRRLNWLSPQVNRHTAYRALSNRFQDPYPPHVVELGTDVRQLILDGLPSENVLATDVIGGYWQLGFNLFQDTNELRTKVEFCDATASSNSPLDGYSGKYDAAYAMLVFHVFNQEEGISFLSRAHRLLAPDGIFFGTTVGRNTTSGPWKPRQDSPERYIYNKDDLEALLQSTGFVEVKVEKTVLGSRMKAQVSQDIEGLCIWSFFARKLNPEWASC